MSICTPMTMDIKTANHKGGIKCMLLNEMTNGAQWLFGNCRELAPAHPSIILLVTNDMACD